MGSVDWDQHFFYHGVFFRALYEYFQLPFWNPWGCGGNVLWQNPQIPILSPVYFLAPFVSMALAMKINIWIHYLIGFLGMHLLLTKVFDFKFGPLVVFLSSVFVFSGGIAVHLFVGHSTFLPALFAPLLYFFVFYSLKSGKFIYIPLAGIVGAVALYNGGVYVFNYTALPLGLICVLWSLFSRRLQPTLAAASAPIFSIFFAAPKVFPVLAYKFSDYAWDTRGGVNRSVIIPIRLIWRSLIDSYQNRDQQIWDEIGGFHEVGNYIGTPATLLFLAALIWLVYQLLRRRASNPFAYAVGLTLMVVFLTMRGNFSELAPYSLMKNVPLIKDMRVPTRFGLAIVPLIVILVSATLGDFVGSKKVEGSLHIFLWALCLLASFDIGYNNSAQLADAFREPSLDHRFHIGAQSQSYALDTTTDPYTGNSPSYRALTRNVNLVNCYEPMQLRHVLHRDQPLLFADQGVNIEHIHFSPSRFTFTVNSSSPGKIYLNQNFIEGWTSTLGDLQLDPATSLGAVGVKAGPSAEHSIYFRPPLLSFGIAVMILAIAISWMLRDRRFNPVRIHKNASQLI